jgi:HEAT repeat protein
MVDSLRKKADETLLLALACGATVESAARQCRLSERTVYRRLHDVSFQGRLQQVRADMVQRAAGLLTAAAVEAVKTLLELQKSSTPAAVRLGAARAVLEIGIRLRESADLEARLSALEARLMTPLQMFPSA